MVLVQTDGHVIDEIPQEGSEHLRVGHFLTHERVDALADQRGALVLRAE